MKKIYNNGSEETLLEIKNELNKIDHNRGEIILFREFDSIKSYKLTELNKFFIRLFILRFSSNKFESFSESSV